MIGPIPKNARTLVFATDVADALLSWYPDGVGFCVDGVGLAVRVDADLDPGVVVALDASGQPIVREWATIEARRAEAERLFALRFAAREKTGATCP